MRQPLLSAGMVVGDTWQVDRPLGRGGMGEVWLAHHLRVDGKLAALKVLRASVEGLPDKLARFRREAEIAARLEHPNIVQVFDFSTLPSGDPYLVMEYLRGESLSTRLNRGPMSLPEVQSLVVQVGSALHTAHAAGVVHRDLKPENIFLINTPTGVQVKVLDFGISKLIDSQTIKTSEDVIMGTPQYMSPEQATAEHAAVTGQSDLFSLATVCFEALTGRRPFAADSLARVVYLVAFEPSPPLASVLPDLPAHVTAAVDHALVKAPARRTPDIATFVREFAQVTLSGTPVPSLPPPQPSSVPSKPSTAPTVGARPAARGPKPSRALAPALVAALVAVVAVGLNAWWSMSPSVEPPAHDAGLVAPSAPVDAGLKEPVDAGPLAPVAMPSDESPRAQTPPRRPSSKLEPLTAEQQELLTRGRGAVDRGRWAEVLDWALKPALADRPEALTLRLLAWCHLGNLGLVNAYKARLTPADRPSVARACAEQGIDL